MVAEAATTTNNLALNDAPVLLHTSEICVNGYQRSASLLSNSQSILPLLQRSTAKAADMFAMNAFVHQYKEHGLELADFTSAFMNVGQVIENYRSM
jgi:tubulin delta